MNTTTTPQPTNTSSSVKPIPRGMRSITPHLVCAGAADAIEFYKKAFGATELNRVLGPDGKILNAAIQIGDSVIMLVDEFKEWGSFGPKSLNGSPVTIHLYVENADQAFDRAVSAGARVRLPLDDMFWGDRYGQLEDPFGHLWWVATHKEDVAPEEMQKRVQAMFGGNSR